VAENFEIEALIQDGIQQRQAGAWSIAQQIYERLTQLQSSSATHWHNLALCFFALGQISLALGSASLMSPR